jgi:opacity protein-like surface antigen
MPMSQGNHPRVWSAFILLGLLVALATPIFALAGTSPAGEWTGVMRTPDSQEVEILLKLDQQGSAWVGTLDSDVIGETSVTGLKVTDTRISFTFKPEGAPYPAHFSGSYVAGDDRITGTFSLRGNSRFVKFNRVPGSETVALAPGEEPVESARIRHDYKLAITARASYWAALHVVKDENYNINNLTVGDWSFDGTLRYYIMDGFNIFIRGYRGAQKTSSDQSKLDRYNDIGLVSQSTWKLDGYEFGIMGYLGNAMMRNSKFNPYLTAAGGYVNWELTKGARGTEVISLDGQPFKGKDPAVAFGFGTEYEVSKHLALEFEWLWRYFMTGDDTKWPDPDNTFGSTHAWAFSFGLTYGFF